MPWNLLGILYAVCAVMCSVGFYKFVYFLSIGYGFAIAGGGIAVFVMYLLSPTKTPLLIVVLQLVLFIIYGARLSGFLLARELKNASFRKTEVAKDTLSKNKEKKMPIFVLAFIWIFVSALYVAQVSPMLFRVINGSTDYLLPLIGMAVSVLGITLESIADMQKSEQKKARPEMVATKGLYRMVRCPNYFGEITFWTGVFISGISTYSTTGQWITAIVAYICIVYIMFNGAQRLEKRQMKRYGENKEYNDYANKTPIIIPLLPIYHLNKKK
jgi:steroid 5-alpha reductase family enzyme